MKRWMDGLLNSGVRKDDSGSVQRSIQMTNITAIGGMLSSWAFAFIYLLIDPILLLPVILINFTTSLLFIPVFFFNRKHRYDTAVVWVILSSAVPAFINLRLYLGYRSGSQMFFLLFALLPVLILPRKHLYLTSFLSGLNLVFFLLSYRFVPNFSLISLIPLEAARAIETISTLFVIVIIVLVFYVNQRIMDTFESDLSAKKKNLESALVEVRKFASVDALTEILNRGHMEQRINDELARGYRYGFPISLAMFDVDLFKSVNDTFGHDTGDVVLKVIATKVKSSIRETDTLGRWGGEEFMILLPYSNESIAAKVASKLCLTIEQIDHDNVGKVTVSFGVAQWDGIESFDKLYKRLDNALYAAKENGRNQVSIDKLKKEFEMSSTKLIWKPEWESGNPEIDRQHRRLIESLSNFVYDDESVKSSYIYDLLVSELLTHFEYEENLLIKIGYHEIERHKSEHRKLVKWLKTLRVEMFEGKPDDFPYATHILEEAVLNHILGEDMKYFPLLR